MSEVVEEDLINSPRHYASDPSGVECIEITRHMSFDIGNAFKYIFRAGSKNLKGDALAAEIEDLKKAVWYLKDHLAQGLEDDWESAVIYGPKLKQVHKSRPQGYIRTAMVNFFLIDYEGAILYIQREIEALEKRKALKDELASG